MTHFRHAAIVTALLASVGAAAIADGCNYWTSATDTGPAPNDLSHDSARARRTGAADRRVPGRRADTGERATLYAAARSSSRGARHQGLQIYGGKQSCCVDRPCNQ